MSGEGGFTYFFFFAPAFDPRTHHASLKRQNVGAWQMALTFCFQAVKLMRTSWVEQETEIRIGYSDCNGMSIGLGS